MTMYVQNYVILMTTQTGGIIISHLICEFLLQRKCICCHGHLIMYISDVQKYQGNVREEENNDNPGKGCSLFRNELTTKEVFDAFNTTTI